MALLIPFHAVHLYDAGIGFLLDPLLEVLVIMAFPVGAVLCACLGCLLALFVPDFPTEVNVPYIEYAGVDVRIHCSSGTLQVFTVCCVDMGNRLSVFD